MMGHETPRKRTLRDLRTCAWSFLGGLVLTLLVSMIARIPGCSIFGVLLAPGFLAAAIVFPGAAHSNWGMTYLGLALVLDACFLALLAISLWAQIRRLWRR